MSEHALDWLREKAIGWSHTPPVNKIDTHHHCVPAFYAKGKLTPSSIFSSAWLILPQRLKNKAAIPAAGRLPAGTLWLPNC